jgi:hypothetical protein
MLFQFKVVGQFDFNLAAGLAPRDPAASGGAK